MVAGKIYPLTEFSDTAPPLYPWMLKHDKKPADWLGIKYKNRTLHEPINILISDTVSQSIREAEDKLLAACTRADFLDRYGHTSDYLVIIDGVAVPQFPSVEKHSFSDKVFLESNNHGRIFGPVSYKGRYWFYAALSREKVQLEPFKHLYVSFNQARDSFAWTIDSTGIYKVAGFVNLGNTILDSITDSSGDHDGIAILLEAVQ